MNDWNDGWIIWWTGFFFVCMCVSFNSFIHFCCQFLWIYIYLSSSEWWWSSFLCHIVIYFIRMSECGRTQRIGNNQQNVVKIYKPTHTHTQNEQMIWSRKNSILDQFTKKKNMTKNGLMWSGINLAKNFFYPFTYPFVETMEKIFFHNFFLSLSLELN